MFEDEPKPIPERVKDVLLAPITLTRRLREEVTVLDASRYRKDFHLARNMIAAGGGLGVVGLLVNPSLSAAGMAYIGLGILHFRWARDRAINSLSPDK